ESNGTLLADATGNKNNEDLSLRFGFSSGGTGIIGGDCASANVNGHCIFTNLSGTVSPLGAGYTGAFTVQVWINQVTSGLNGGVYFAIWGTTSAKQAWIINADATGTKPNFITFDSNGGTSTTVSSSTGLADSTWHQVVVGYDGVNDWIQVD